MPVDVVGYSERGMVNSLCYQIWGSKDPEARLLELLNRFRFPFQISGDHPAVPKFEDGKLRIEQSFSDFGDLDLLILLDGKVKQAIFIEAKVKTSQRSSWPISMEWDGFLQRIKMAPNPQEKMHRSNIFVQLYRKMRLVHKLRQRQVPLLSDSVSVEWNLGQNRLVQAAADELAAYCDDKAKQWYLLLVPESDENMGKFFCNKLKSFALDKGIVLHNWDTSRWGYCVWQEIEEFCRKDPTNWKLVLDTFEYNDGQVYATPPGVRRAGNLPAPGNAVIWNHPTNGQLPVIVVRRGSRNTRVLLNEGGMVLVANSELVA